MEQALEISRKVGARQSEGYHLGNLGNVYRALDELDKGIGYLEQALVIRREISDSRGEGVDLANLGLAYKQLGDIERAKVFWQAALTKLIPGTPEYAQVEGWLQTEA